jgi:hypothetical protein
VYYLPFGARAAASQMREIGIAVEWAFDGIEGTERLLSGQNPFILGEQ